MPLKRWFVPLFVCLAAVGVFASAQEEDPASEPTLTPAVEANAEAAATGESAASQEAAEPVLEPEPSADEPAPSAEESEPSADGVEPSADGGESAPEPESSTEEEAADAIEEPVSEPIVETPAVVEEPASADPPVIEPAPTAAPLAAELAAARSNLAAAMSRFERRVNPTSSFGAGWLAYLQWDGLQKQLSDESTPDAAALSASLGQLNSGAEGLEVPEARAVAAALDELLAVVSLSRAKNPAATIDKQSEALAGLAAKDSLDPRLDLYAIERRLALLSATDAGAEAVRATRSAFLRPNTHVSISTGLLNRMLASPGAECVDVNECILGTRLRGSGLSSSSLRLSTQPSADSARLLFSLSGTTNSRTRGVNGPVAIYSTGATKYTASKTVVLSDASFRMFGAAASARTRSTTRDIKKIGGGIGSRLIERIAAGRVAEQRSQADAIAGSRAGRRVASRFDERLNQRLIEARRNYDEKLIAPLARRGAQPEWINFSTTSDSLEVHTLQATDTQLAAPSSPPSGPAGELSASLHESAVCNLLSAYLGGATLRRDEPDGPPIYEGGVKPKWLDNLGDAERPTLAEFKPWSLTFRDTRPVSIGFRDGKVQVAVHAAVLATEDKTYEGWDLISTYEPVRAGEGWALERQGDIEVLPTGFDPSAGRPLPSKKGALRRNLQEALNEADGRLPSRVPLDDLVLEKPAGSVRSLAVEDVKVSDGWLQVAMRAL